MQFINSQKNKFIVCMMALLMLMITVLSMTPVHALSYSNDKLIVGYSNGFEDVSFSKDTTVGLYYDEDTPITINWLKANPDFYFVINFSASPSTYGRPSVGVAGRPIEIISSKTFDYNTFMTSTTTTFPESSYNTPLIFKTGEVESFSVKSSIDVTPLQRAMNFVVQVAVSLFTVLTTILTVCMSNTLLRVILILPLCALGLWFLFIFLDR